MPNFSTFKWMQSIPPITVGKQNFLDHFTFVFRWWNELFLAEILSWPYISEISTFSALVTVLSSGFLIHSHETFRRLLHFHFQIWRGPHSRIVALLSLLIEFTLAQNNISRCNCTNDVPILDAHDNCKWNWMFSTKIRSLTIQKHLSLHEIHLLQRRSSSSEAKTSILKWTLLFMNIERAKTSFEVRSSFVEWKVNHLFINTAQISWVNFKPIMWVLEWVFYVLIGFSCRVSITNDEFIVELRS